MNRNGRRLVLGLTVLGLLAMSVTVVAAREFPRPVDLRAGWHEEGLYVQQIPGTYGRLWPIKPLIPQEPGKGNVSSQSAQLSLTPEAPQISLGAGPLAARVADPVALTSAGINKGAGPVNAQLGNFLSGGSDETRVETLESGLRDIINRLNAQ